MSDVGGASCVVVATFVLKDSCLCTCLLVTLMMGVVTTSEVCVAGVVHVLALALVTTMMLDLLTDEVVIGIFGRVFVDWLLSSLAPAPPSSSSSSSCPSNCHRGIKTLLTSQLFMNLLSGLLCTLLTRFIVFNILVSSSSSSSSSSQAPSTCSILSSPPSFSFLVATLSSQLLGSSFTPPSCFPPPSQAFSPLPFFSSSFTTTSSSSSPLPTPPPLMITPPPSTSLPLLPTSLATLFNTGLPTSAATSADAAPSKGSLKCC